MRFNRQDLAARIKLLGAYRDRVKVHQQDALELLRQIDTRDALLYVDPPYLLQGDELYMNTLGWSDHQRLAKLLTQRHRRWVLTYDADPRVPDVLYKNLRCAQFSIKHTAAAQEMGTEYVVFSDPLRINTLARLSKGPVSWVNG